MVEEVAGQIVDFEVPLPGLDLYIKENDGNIENALKALWLQHSQEMEWRGYAIGANKSIMKLYMQGMTTGKVIRDSLGALSSAGFTDDRDLKLENSKSFHKMIDLCKALPDESKMDQNSERHIKKVRRNPDKSMQLTYDCGHTEDVPADKSAECTVKKGDKLICPSCHAMMDVMKKSV